MSGNVYSRSYKKASTEFGSAASEEITLLFFTFNNRYVLTSNDLSHARRQLLAFAENKDVVVYNIARMNQQQRAAMSVFPVPVGRMTDPFDLARNASTASRWYPRRV